MILRRGNGHVAYDLLILWLECQRDKHEYVKSWDSYQNHKSIPKYCTTLHLPIYKLFKTIFIDFSGSFPVFLTENKFFLVVVEHLVG